jgi:hypothetical protein
MRLAVRVIRLDRLAPVNSQSEEMGGTRELISKGAGPCGTAAQW